MSKDLFDSTRPLASVILLTLFDQFTHFEINVNWGWMYRIICMRRSWLLAPDPVRIKLTTSANGNRIITELPRATAEILRGIDCSIFLLPDERRGRERRREGHNEEKKKIRSE